MELSQTEALNVGHLLDDAVTEDLVAAAAAQAELDRVNQRNHDRADQCREGVIGTAPTLIVSLRATMV